MVNVAHRTRQHGTNPCSARGRGAAVAGLVLDAFVENIVERVVCEPLSVFVRVVVLAAAWAQTLAARAMPHDRDVGRGLLGWVALAADFVRHGGFFEREVELAHPVALGAEVAIGADRHAIAFVATVRRSL